MRKPMIGIVPLIDYEKESYWMLPGYMKGIQEAGGIPIMLPISEDKEELIQLLSGLNGILITGGQDVSPELYKEEKVPACGECSPERDGMERVLFQLALEQNKPILGICRGLQFINAIMGGTLYQDLATQHPSEINHGQKPPYDVPSHKVGIIKESPLYDLLQQEELAVNSCHHQAIKDLALGLETMAISEDGLVEAIRVPGKKFVWAVQWHPECSYLVDEASRRLLGVFVRECPLKI